MIGLIVLIIVIGFFAWLAVTYIPMAEPFPKLIIGLAIFLAALAILDFFGLLGGSGPHFVHSRW